MVMILRSQTRAANLQQHAAVAPVLRGRQPQGGKARRAASLASTSAASISTAVGPDNTTNRGRQPKRVTVICPQCGNKFKPEAQAKPLGTTSSHEGISSEADVEQGPSKTIKQAAATTSATIGAGGRGRGRGAPAAGRTRESTSEEGSDSGEPASEPAGRTGGRGRRGRPVSIRRRRGGRSISRRRRTNVRRGPQANATNAGKK